MGAGKPHHIYMFHCCVLARPEVPYNLASDCHVQQATRVVHPGDIAPVGFAGQLQAAKATVPQQCGELVYKTRAGCRISCAWAFNLHTSNNMHESFRRCCRGSYSQCCIRLKSAVVQ